jgi:hypothetical protein
MDKLPKNQKYYYDVEIKKAKLNFQSAKQFLLSGKSYIRVPEKMIACDDNFPELGKIPYSLALKNSKTHIYYHEIKKWGNPVELDTFKEYEYWKSYPMPTNYIDQGEDYLPYVSENKYIGGDFDNFLKENNFDFKRDINWAIKMLGLGKIMTREGNRSLVLFPPQKSNNQNIKITVEDLFAEDWIVVPNKTFKEILDDLYAGKTIRRISWYPSKGIGKFAQPDGISYIDLIADDWEVVDVVAEVNKFQKDIEDGKY